MSKSDIIAAGTINTFEFDGEKWQVVKNNTTIKIDGNRFFDILKKEN